MKRTHAKSLIAKHSHTMNKKLLNATLVLLLLLTGVPAATAQVTPTAVHKGNATSTAKNDTADNNLFLNAKAKIQETSGKVKGKVSSHKDKKKAEIIAALEAKEAKTIALQKRRDVQARKMMEQIAPERRPGTLTYALRDNHNLKMDVWQPQQQREDKACVVYVFGGGFFCGSRNDSSSIAACQALTDQGFVAVSIDYRLGLAETAVDTVSLHNITNPFIRSINWAVEDLSAAIAYLCKHAAEIGIDPTRIVLTGASAGAITVLQTDYCRANALPAASALPADFVPMAVISYSGALLVENGTMKYDAPPAPTCLMHGTEDRIVHYSGMRPSLRMSLKGSSKIANVMQRDGSPYWFFRFKNRGHEVNTYLPATIGLFTLFVDMAEEDRVTFLDATYEDVGLPPSPNVKDNVFDLYFK